MKKAKTLFIGLLTVVLLTGLVLSTGCGAEPEEEEEEEEEEKLLIVSVMQYGADVFFLPHHLGAVAAAEEYGVDFDWLLPASYDFQDMIAVLETVLAKGEVDGFVLEVGDPSALLPMAKLIKAAGIPMVITNELIKTADYISEEVYNSYCGADPIEVGELMAKQVELNMLGEGVWAKAVGYEGTGEVSGKMAFLLDSPGSLNNTLRCQGSQDYMAQFPGVIDLGVYDVTHDYAKGMEVCIDILTANPDIVATLAGGGMATAPSAMAVLEMDLVGKVIVVGMDYMPPALDLIKDKVIAALIGQNPYDQGYLPVKALAEYLLYGTPMPKWLPTALEVVTLDNVDEIIEREAALLE